MGTDMLLDSNRKTLYMKLYDDIKKNIINGNLGKDKKLPSIRNSMLHYEISKNTVIKAYHQLELEGYVRSVEKKGFYVNEIENILVSKDSQVKYKKSNKKKYKYDFSMDGVDQSGFPFSIWKKIYNEIINKSHSELLLNVESKGDYKLRIEIAKYVNNSRGLNLSADDLIISAGTEYLFSLVKKLFDDDTIYGFENPGYAWGNSFFYRDLKNVVPIKMDSEGIMIEKLNKYNVDVCLITPAHQFPTGNVMSINRRIQLLNRTIERNSYIIEDDYDGEFKYKGKPVPALKSMDINDRVIYMGTFSKSLSPALRISYMALPKDLMQKYDTYFKGYTCSCSTFVQRALAEFMNRGDFEKHINRMRTIYSKKYELCEKLFSNTPELELHMPKSGNSFIIKINRLKNIDDFIEKCERNSINLIPVSKYRYKKVNKNDFIFGFAKIPIELLEDGINQLKSIINKELP